MRGPRARRPGVFSIWGISSGNLYSSSSLPLLFLIEHVGFTDIGVENID